jgi:hypothetical protein
MVLTVRLDEAVLREGMVMQRFEPGMLADTRPSAG